MILWLIMIVICFVPAWISVFEWISRVTYWHLLLSGTRQTQTSGNQHYKSQCCQLNLRTEISCCSNNFLTQHFSFIPNERWVLWQCKSSFLWMPLSNVNKWGIFRRGIIKLPSFGNSVHNGSAPMMPTETAHCVWETDRERSIRNNGVDVFKHLKQGSWMKR